MTSKEEGASVVGTRSLELHHSDSSWIKITWCIMWCLLLIIHGIDLAWCDAWSVSTVSAHFPISNIIPSAHIDSSSFKSTMHGMASLRAWDSVICHLVPQRYSLDISEVTPQNSDRLPGGSFPCDYDWWIRCGDRFDVHAKPRQRVSHVPSVTFQLTRCSRLYGKCWPM